MKLINIGFGNMVSAARMVAVVSPESAPIKRIITDSREKGQLIDATYGRRTRAVIITDSSHIILSAIQPETIAGRLSEKPLRTRWTVRKMSKKGVVFIISGPSGCGKSTLLHQVFVRRDKCYFSISATTRAPRPGETDGVDYKFLARERFSELIAQGELLEYAEYVGNYYGTPAGPVREHVEAGDDVFLDIEVQGARQVKEKLPDAVMIFIAPPSIETLEDRLRGRLTESEEKVLRRLDTAKREIALSEMYDYVVINDEVDRAVDELLMIIENEKRNRKDMN